jgi:Holliday junction DNA helicase RuvA
MIHQVRGTVLAHEPAGVVVEVAGFGVLVHTAVHDRPPAGASVVLRTHLVVRKDGLDLYGFTDPADRAFFGQLLTVSGVGPKTALAVLSRAPRESLMSALASRDLTYLTRVAGIGKKAAEKMVVELSEKMVVTGGPQETTDADVFDTLVALGYTEREARAALARVPLHIAGRDARLKAALGPPSA